MPAAAVIPAPIAYIKVVAVKKLVVESGGNRSCKRGLFSRAIVSLSFFKLCMPPQGVCRGDFGEGCSFNFLDPALLALTGWGSRSRSFTLKKLGCLKQAY